jgi:hypothetical protein
MKTNQESLATCARWIGIALVYFVLAVALGVAMAASRDFRLRGLHVHLNLLGWVSAALMGLIYRQFPQAAASRLARWNFGLYNTGLPVMMVSLGGLLLGVEAMGPVVAVSSIAVLVAVLLFALAIWRERGGSAVHVQQAQAATQ